MSEFTAQLQAALAPSYTLERELTGGGMSRVFVATDTTLGRKVVIKVLPPELAAGVNHERFRREIQVAAQLQHPHIVPLLSAGEQHTLIWYTMPYIHGLSLREALARGDRFSVREVVRILHEVAEALEYAHGMGVIHRDIKPGNVLMQGSHALVTDFGVSKAISAAMPQSGYTSAGMAIGTPAYMAPEQIAADPAADHRMDLYALGLLGYELLTGKVPFKEASPQQTMAAQLTREPEPVERSRPDVPVALRALLSRLLQKAPSDRPASASEVVAALDAMGSGSGETLAMPPMAPSRGRLVAIATAGVLLVASAWLAGQRRGEAVVSSQMRDSIALAESLQAVAPAATMLSREDSVAIAAAVTQRIAERPQVAPAERRDSVSLTLLADSIRREIQRVVLDSLMRGMRVPTLRSADAAAMAAEAEVMAREAAAVRGSAPPVRRVVVAPPRPSRGRPDLNVAADVLVDSLNAGFARNPRFAVVPHDSVEAALQRSRTVDAVREALDADIIISLSFIPTPDDSITRLLQVRDLGVADGRSEIRIIPSRVPQTDPTRGAAEVSRDVQRTLFEMERAARQRPGPAGTRVRVIDGISAPPAPPRTPNVP
ncbi:serine/threonine-protein kinase [Pseudogemmatithrix spongiicola]|uniref:non-specific serine/threonine protein kinase n=1 Tax=Pseudogemmatithrix spongiicola TaxID=3062599 RepID=A0AA49JYS9_9BACT|nr:serine/threonine-protein kinase [Gemmatimonadaceae bacterium 'strain 138']WKW14436.1 serine/threonine-protein kinase [Gemmatimonadaceae bacterium 'strain 318']